MDTPPVAQPRAVSRRLLRWYRAERRSLPWRDSRDSYRVWVSEVMLQQTRVEVVVPYFERFVARFPRLVDLARAREEEVLALWSGLGYYRRARSLLEGARFVVERHGGEFPRTTDAALRIPGVGPYTAAAVLSIAYGIPVPVVDGNVERVLARLFRLPGDPRQSGTARRLRAIAEKLIPARAASDFNQAMMELGATVCTPARPACPDCVLRTFCASHARGDVSRFPETAPGRKPVAVTIRVAIVRRGGRYLLERSADRDILKNLWMFPFVESVSAGDLLRSLEARLGGSFSVRRELEPVRHAITFRKITAHPSLVGSSGPISARARKDFRWARLTDLGSSLAVSSLALKIRERLLALRQPG